jgi:hypothetical protein
MIPTKNVSQARAIISVFQQVEPQKRFVDGKDLDGEDVKSEARQHRFDNDFGRIEPVLRGSAVEHQLQRTKADAERNKSEPVETRRRVVPRFMQKQKHARRGHDADGNIDVKHPAPRIVVGEESTERRPQDRPQHDDHRPDSHDLSALLERITVDDDGLREGRQRCAECALKKAKQDHLVQSLCEAAHRRRDRESDEAHQKYLAPTEARRKPAYRTGQDRRGNNIGCEHPGDLVAGRLQAALHIGKRHVGDGRVQHLHEHAEHDADDSDAKPEGRFAQCRRAQGVSNQWQNSAGSRRPNDTRLPLFSTEGLSRSM